jgi:hypothetical protein
MKLPVALTETHTATPKERVLGRLIGYRETTPQEAMEKTSCATCRHSRESNKSKFWIFLECVDHEIPHTTAKNICETFERKE